MPLIPWRKLQAGFSGRGNTKDVASVVQHVVNTTIIKIQEAVQASTVTPGIVRLATITETNTGTNSDIAVTPDGLAGSIFGTRAIGVIAIERATSITIGDGKVDVPIPACLNGMNLIRAQAIVITAGTTNPTTVAIYNATDSQEMLSTNISIASGATVGTIGTINTAYDDIATNDVLRIDVDAVSTTAPKGLLVILEFRLP